MLISGSPCKQSIGVVITCFNYEEFVADAIISVLSQTRQADKFLIIDDGSTDRSLEIINRVAVGAEVISIDNCGTIKASRIGLDMMRTDAVILLDADDMLMPNCLETIDQFNFKYFVKVQYDLYVVGASGKVSGRLFVRFPKPYTSDDLADQYAKTGTYFWPVTSGNAYSRWFLDANRHIEPPLSFDGALNTVAPAFGSVATISVPLGKYRMHSNNYSLARADGVPKSQIPDFQRKIRLRRDEIRLLASVRKPTDEWDLSEVILNEYHFMDYRLMARIVGSEDFQDIACYKIDLFKDALFALISDQRFTTYGRFTRLIWLLSLFLLPQCISRQFVSFRYRRNNNLI